MFARRTKHYVGAQVDMYRLGGERDGKAGKNIRRVLAIPMYFRMAGNVEGGIVCG